MKVRIAALLLGLGLAACGGTDQPHFGPEQLQAWRDAAQAHGGADVATLSQDASAMTLAQNLFSAHCASCHGSDGRGRLRIPDLVADVLDYGDSESAIATTIHDGRHSTMPKFGHLLGEFELGVMAAHVKSLSGGEPLDPLYTDKAQELFAEHCVACHGADARGTQTLGAPDLTDASWQFSDAVNGIRMTMTGGTESVCPPQAAVLSEAEMGLLTAYVLKLRAGALIRS